MADDKEQEKARLKGEEARLQSEKSSLESANRDLNSKITALEQARKNIGEAKDSIKKQKKCVKKVPGDHGKGWTGATFNEVKEKSEKGSLFSAYESYIREIDGVEDGLNNEIARLKGEVWKNEGLIGQIKTALNNIWTALRNLCN